MPGKRGGRTGKSNGSHGDIGVLSAVRGEHPRGRSQGKPCPGCRSDGPEEERGKDGRKKDTSGAEGGV